MGDRLQGKVALITGGTSGIGEATAELFVREGAQVVITGRSEEKGAGIAARLGANAAYVRADVTRESDIAASVDATVERFGRLDVMFNNAASGTRTSVDSITSEEIDEGVHLLLSSVVLGMRYAVEPMKASGGGSIINNSSIAALRYGQGDLLYGALKAAVTHYSKMAGVELGPLGIRVNVISPGAIATPIFWGGSERANTMSDEENAAMLEKLKGNLAKGTTLPMSGLASDIAEAALYLGSDAARFVNCHDLVVDGGRTSLFNQTGSPL
ncbi:MAG: SDR family oxidoreductase [Dehalococcoidia bacterium]|nr:SDR family oxidoreductase [Dehalococcoidia bacterium]